MSKTLTRPTAFALAFVNAAAQAINKVDHLAQAPWPARRVLLAPPGAGMVVEPTFNAHLSKRTYNALHAQGQI